MSEDTKNKDKDRLEDFIRNDFAHLREDVNMIKGELIILIPLVIAILGISVGSIFLL
jgi:hypothetical protein